MRLKKVAVDVDSGRELGAMMGVGVHGDVGILLNWANEEL